MQMVAASKMRKAQEATLTMRPFAQLLYRMQRERRRTPAISPTRCWRCAKSASAP